MVLASCPDCNREVSTRAHHCVHCGRPWPGRKCGAACAVALAAIVALCVFAGVVFMKARCAKLGAAKAEATEAIEKAKASVMNGVEKLKGDCCPAEAPAAVEAPATPETPKEE